MYIIHFLLKGVIIIFINNVKNKSSNYQDFLANLNKDDEISYLKNELDKANKIIEQQKITINDLENKLYNYKNTINQKELELSKLRTQLNNNYNDNNSNNVNFDEIISVNFISTDQNIHFSVPCVKTNTPAEAEEKLYQEFPEYRETNNNFLFNGNQILRFKTIEQNKITKGIPVTLDVPE